MNYRLNSEGFYSTDSFVKHRNEEYDEAAFKQLFKMQDQHFWYRGRHRFILNEVDKFQDGKSWSAVDLGGGVGGWLNYLSIRRGNVFENLALADSSKIALKMAGETLLPSIKRFNVDLMDLKFKNQWDCAFLFDVIEHIEDDIGALEQAAKALKPGGYLFVTTPALKFFWSYNDILVKHKRRYSKKDFNVLAESVNLELTDVRYFMFFLSPLLWIARRNIDIENMSDEDKLILLQKTHSIPNSAINELLYRVFALETPVGHKLQFPWGTSILGVFKKT